MMESKDRTIASLAVILQRELTHVKGLPKMNCLQSGLSRVCGRMDHEHNDDAATRYPRRDGIFTMI